MAPLEESLAYWIKQEVVRIRKDAGASVADIASAARVTAKTIERFEALNPRDSTIYPAQMDTYLAAYASLRNAEAEDARDIYELAVRRWKESGKRPGLPDHPMRPRVD